MDLIENLVNEVKWRYTIGSIDEINKETVTEIAEEIYPNLGTIDSPFLSDMELGKVVFEALMRI